MLKVLIVKRDKLGDLLLTVPLIEVLASRLPEVKIDVWATAFTTFVVESHPSVNQVWPMYKGTASLWRNLQVMWAAVLQILRIRSQRYDWVIVASGESSPRAIKKARWAGGQRLIAFVPFENDKLDFEYRGVTHGLPPPDGRVHESIRLASLAIPILRVNQLNDEVGKPKLHLSNTHRSLGLRYLQKYALIPGNFVVVGIGARKVKRQPTIQQLLDWTDHFHHKGYRSVLSYTPGNAADPGYPADDEIANQLMAQRPEIVPLCGSIQEAAAVIHLAAFSVIPDSGLMHVAAASKGGVIGLFADVDHSPHPSQWGPRGDHCSVIIAPRTISELPTRVFLETFSNFIESPRTK